tara:strand:- start:36 stop:473 length:438 start_codon:yes stop_codon:yes gene_type:complete
MKRFATTLFILLLSCGALEAQTEYRWAVDNVTDEFVYGGTEPYDVVPGLSPGQIRIVLSRPPDVINERYSGDPEDPFRVATQQEIDDATNALSLAQAAAFIDSREIRALIWEIIEAVSPPATEAKFNNSINRLRDTWNDQPFLAP